VDRNEKNAFIAKMNERLGSSEIVLVMHYHGLTVAQMSQLRGSFRAAGAHLEVVKNKLTKRALQGTEFADLANLLTGPVVVGISNDPVSIAKVVFSFAKENKDLKIVGGVLNNQLLNSAVVEQLSKLPSLDELRGKIIGLISAPATKVAGVLQAPAGQLARVFSAYSSK